MKDIYVTALFVVLLVVLSVTNCSSQTSRNDVTEPDMIRNTYLRVEKTLWENSINNNAKTQNDRLKAIFTEHNEFVTYYLKDKLDLDDLKMLVNLNGWQSFLSDVISIHRVFISFQQHLNRESKFIDKGSFNEEVSMDLVDHVLDESSFPLSKAIDNLHSIVTHKLLFAFDVSVS